MSTMAKKVDAGPLAPVVKNVSTIYDVLFDHHTALQSEQQVMLREFELKRGNLDIETLQAANAALSGPRETISVIQKVSEQNMDKLIAATKEANRIASETLAKESQHIAQRTKLREGGEMMEKEQNAQFLAEQQKRMQQIDELFEHQKKLLEEQYKV